MLRKQEAECGGAGEQSAGSRILRGQSAEEAGSRVWGSRVRGSRVLRDAEQSTGEQITDGAGNRVLREQGAEC